MTLDREKIAERNKIKEFCRNWAGECQVPCGYCWDEPEPQPAPADDEAGPDGFTDAERIAGRLDTQALEIVELRRAILAALARAEAAERRADLAGQEAAARWTSLVVETDKRVAAERERDTFKQHADNTRTQLHHWQDRAEVAERERDEAVLKQLAAENSLHNQEIIARGDKEAWRKTILADRAAREAAEATVARLREAIYLYVDPCDVRPEHQALIDECAATISAPAAPEAASPATKECTCGGRLTPWHRQGCPAAPEVPDGR